MKRITVLSGVAGLILSFISFYTLWTKDGVIDADIDDNLNRAMREDQIDKCAQPKKIGRCKAAMRRYYYDNTAGECKQFIYGGCGGNKNNFKSLQQCQNVCSQSYT